MVSSHIWEYLAQPEPHAGSDAVDNRWFWLRVDIVLGLVEKCIIEQGCTVNFDNLFTTLELICSLLTKGIGGLGPFRENVQNAHLCKTSELTKKRGIL